jgi:hypothetical protein
VNFKKGCAWKLLVRKCGAGDYFSIAGMWSTATHLVPRLMVQQVQVGREEIDVLLNDIDHPCKISFLAVHGQTRHL